MDWLTTPSDPNGIYHDPGPVVIGAGDVDLSSNVLQVTGSTSLDTGQILTGGDGSIQCNTTGVIAVNDTTDNLLASFGNVAGSPGFSLLNQASAGFPNAPSFVTSDLNNNLLLTAGANPSDVRGQVRLLSTKGVRITSLPSNAGTPPAGLSAGDLWIDTTAGSHQGIVKVY